MHRSTILSVCVAAAMLTAPSAFAQSVSWRVVAGTQAALAIPGFPAGTRAYSDVLLADTGAERIGLRMTSPGASAGYWARQQGSWARYSGIGVAGAVLGPGRSGGESAHVFLQVSSGGSGAGTDGQRVMIAQAGDPANTVGATWGLWRWDTTQNIEIARVLTDGALGPNLGAGTTFSNSSTFASARMANAGRVLINANVTLPSTTERRLLAMHVPGQGNVPCMLRSSTDPSLSPGLTPGDTFDATWSQTALALTSGGRVYGAFSASGSRSGIWQVCAGAPRAVAADDVNGALGPEIGNGTASFVDGNFGTPRPGLEGQFYFAGRYRPASGEASQAGLFWHDGAANRPLAMNDPAGIYGPNWEGTTWATFDTTSLMGAGEYAAFEASVRTSDGATPDGLWRVRAERSPEPVAIIDVTGAYAPEPGRTWSTFLATAVLANGDILAHARTNPNSEVALWLFKSGAAPRRVLVAGQAAQVPTATGTVVDTVQSFSIDSGAALYSGGEDSWVGADGSVLVQATLTTYGAVRLLAIPSNPVDLIFRNGFDG